MGKRKKWENNELEDEEREKRESGGIDWWVAKVEVGTDTCMC